MAMMIAMCTADRRRNDPHSSRPPVPHLVVAVPHLRAPVSQTFVMRVPGLFSVKEDSLTMMVPDYKPPHYARILRSTDNHPDFGSEVWECWGDAARWPEPMPVDDLDNPGWVAP